MHRDVAAFLQNYGWFSAELLWLLYATGTVLAIYSDRSELRLNRHRYVINGIFRLIGAYVLFELMIYALDGIDPAKRLATFDARVGVIAVTAAGYVPIVAFVFVRLVVQRLRDAAIPRKWAYLMLLPGIAHLLMLLIALYPPSRPPAVPTARLKQTLRRADAAGWE